MRTPHPAKRQKPTGSRRIAIASKAPTIIDISRIGATRLSGLADATPSVIEQVQEQTGWLIRLVGGGQQPFRFAGMKVLALPAGAEQGPVDRSELNAHAVLHTPATLRAIMSQARTAKNGWRARVCTDRNLAVGLRRLAA